MATKNVVTGERYMDINRKLHEIERQLLQKGGYPHDLEWLESVLQRATEGCFFPEDDVLCRVSVMGRPASRCLWRLGLDNERELMKEIQSLYAPEGTTPPPYKAWVTTVRLQHQMSWNGILGLLDRRHLHPASLEESCGFLEKNRTLQQNGPILCLDGFGKGDRLVMLVFTGDQRRRFTRLVEQAPDEPFTPNVRILAREQIVTIP